MPKAGLSSGTTLALRLMYKSKPTRPNGLAGREGLPYVLRAKS